VRGVRAVGGVRRWLLAGNRRADRLAKNGRGEYTGNMKERLYLDNCSFNRPYDDQSLLKNRLESEAKIYIQSEIFNGTYELAWSYIMDYEISFNPFSDRKNQIVKWKRIASFKTRLVLTRLSQFFGLRPTKLLF
jgi:hypothetical protein